MDKVAKAISTLTIFSMIERILGFLFKVYLTNEMGDTMLGIYQAALSFFYVLLALTTSGLPLVTGKTTATYEITGMKKKTNSLVSAGLIINIIISVSLCLIVIAGQGLLKNVLTSEMSVYALLLFLPALVFGATGAAFRGYLWGREKYFSVSVIELTEQIARVLICITLFLVGVDKLEAAAFSLIASMLLNALLCAICFFKAGGRLQNPKGQLKPLFKSSAPISGLRAASSLVNSIMAVIVPLLFVSSGLNNDTALAYYGAALGMAFPLMYIPVTVVGALAYTLIPTLSKATAQKDKKEIKRQVDSAIAFSVVAAAIFIPVFYALGEPLGLLIFKSETAGKFLKLGGILLIPISLESIVSSMMNSLGLEVRGFLHYMTGSAVMVGIMFCFYGNFTVEVLFWSLFTSLILSTVMDIISIRKKTGASLGFIRTIAFSAGLAIPAIFICKWTFALMSFMPVIVSLGIAGVIGTVSFILLAIGFGLLDIGVIFSKRKKSKSVKLKSLQKSGGNGILDKVIINK